MSTDFYVGVPRWRESIVKKRERGVWDPHTLKRENLTLRDGRNLSYFVDGPKGDEGRDLPYIFAFHAMFLSGNAFITSRPPRDYVLVCVHRPGYFGSSPVDEHYTYEQFALDIRELADHVGARTFSVVGHSSGGPNALACASFLPDRVTSLAILAGDPEYAADGVPQQNAMHDCCLGCCLPKFMWFVPFFRVSNGLNKDFTLERQPYPFRTEEIVQPALCVLGEEDGILPMDVSRKVHDRLPNSELRVLPGLGHNQLLKDEVLAMVFQEVVRLSATT